MSNTPLSIQGLIPVFNFEFPDQSGINALMSDVEDSAAMLQKDLENQCLRRIYVRSIFAMVEGTTDYMKMLTHGFVSDMLEPARIGLGMLHAQCPVPLFSDVIRSDELSLLRNERIEVRENGKPRIKITYLDFKTNLRIAIEMFCRVFKLDRDSSLYDSDGWDRLIQGEAIRNRIMHPKTIQSIAIGDEELPILQGGGQWIYDTYGELLSSVGGSLKIASEDFERWLNTLQDDLLKQVLLLFEKSKSS